MSEQRVVYLDAISVADLVRKMNGLFGMGGADGTEIECIEHYAIDRDGNSWIAVVLVRVQSMVVWEVDEAEEAAIEAQQEYEAAIGVKPR